MKNKEAIEKHYNLACEYAANEVERLARIILKAHPNLDEFIMAMGSYFFTYKNSNQHLSAYKQKMNSSWNIYYVDSYAYLKPINDFLGKWDNYLKITGDAMRFTAYGPKITDW